MICALSFVNAYYIGQRYKLPAFDLQQSLVNIQSFVEVSDLNASVIDNAFRLKVKDFEDAIQYFSAMSCNADVIVTRNKKDFIYSSIPVLTPAEFLEQIGV